MIDDMIDSARHIQSDGMARPGPYCAIGSSYGGYAVMMMAIKDPDNVACIVSFAGVSRPFDMMGAGASDSAVRFWEDYMGSRFDGDAERASITPAMRTSSIRAPILMIHGDEDTTVPIVQMQVVESAMADRNNAWFVELEGEDHYLGTNRSREVLLSRSLDLLQQTLPVE
jgi:dipeptidyl aminopeptidase/acylaminoacyl peptidase